MALEDGVHKTLVELRPTYFLERKRRASEQTISPAPFGKAALIILNSPLTDIEYFRRLHAHSSFCICADGGANRLHDLLTSGLPNSRWQEGLKTALPELIHGDLDSLDDGVRRRYEQLGVRITQDPDQYSTDFGKAVKVSLKRVPDAKDVLVLGSLGGRVDQGIGLLHELYREQKQKHPEVRFWLFSETSVSVMLQPGTTSLHMPLSGGLIKRNVGILPIYGPARITLKGFEWDVEEWATEMGGNVSTSNHIAADQIFVTTDREVLFTVERATSR
ncbi:THI80-thiamin pyrophosphokinase [Teratosphaeria destructans]|uniref:Thiamine pyrophosphokinase n=1 Tax=Teratosphaeria destructans TaxID=418781 RepID=A0A9W7SX04_9PEZI|nr:THI80-thiamin pyrophosphokinase [Teratosphaeria destructans]